MNLFKSILIIVLFCFVDESNAGQNLQQIRQKIYQLIEHQDKTKTEIAGLQMVLLKKGNIVFEHAEGIATINPDGTYSPLTIDHKVRVASISKLILTMAFMSLVDAGDVDLDEDVSIYLGFSLKNPHSPNHKITARQLLAHTSSIRDGGDYFLPIGENIHDFFRQSKHYQNGKYFSSEKKQAPAEYFNYANLNFVVIAGIIEKVSGKRMDVFVKERLFDPLNLNISFNVCDLAENNFSQLATLFRKGEGGESWQSDGPWKAQVDGNELVCFYGGPKFKRSDKPQISLLSSYKTGVNPSLFSPQGGLRASAKELAILMQLMLSKRKNQTHIISQSSINQMLTQVWHYSDVEKNGNTSGESNVSDTKSYGLMKSYGLSTHIIDLQDWNLSATSKKLYGHLGSAYGFLGQFWFDPLTGDGVVIFITGVGSDPALPEQSTPLYSIEKSVLALALDGLTHFN